MKTTAFQFFWKHAGYSYDPKIETERQGRARCARELVNAEKHAQTMEWSTKWDYDPYHAHEGMDCKGEEHLDAALYNQRGECLASLGSICGADEDYRRVVEAELALEAMEWIKLGILEGI